MEIKEVIEGSTGAMAAGFVATLPRLGVAVCLLALTWLLVRFGKPALRSALQRTRMRRALVELVVDLGNVGIWILALFVAAGVAFPSVTPANILTGLGLGSLAVGLAFRDIFENFFAGILILYREPFRLGDCIECTRIEGFVEEITTRDTHLRQTDGQRVVIPNGLLFKNPVTVRTDRPIRRTTTFCRVGFGADVDAARDVIRATVEGSGSVVREKEVQIFAHAFTESGIEFEVTWWTGSRPVDVRRSRDEVVAKVKRALDEAGIGLGVPRRVLGFDGPLAIEDGDAAVPGRAGRLPEPPPRPPGRFAGRHEGDPRAAPPASAARADP